MIPVLLTVVLAVSMPALAQEAPLLMADSFGVSNAGGAAGSTVSVPLEIANVSNGSIQTIVLYMNYSESVISLESVDTGPLTAGWISNLGANKHSITIATSEHSKSISNSSTDDVVYLNFHVVGGPGDTCLMIPENIDFSNTANRHGRTTAKSGILTVNAAPAASDENVITVGSGSSGEPSANIAIKEVVRQYITRGTTIAYQFKEAQNAIEFVRFDAKTTAGYIVATVEVLKGTSTLVSTLPSGEVYQNMNICVGTSRYATDENIANPVIGFKVARSWIDEYNIDESTIRLNRYTPDVWNPLSTTKIREDSKYLYFEARTPRFSSFAITGAVAEAEAEAGGGGIVTVSAEGVEETGSSDEKKSGLPGFGLLTGLSVMLIAVRLLREEK